MLTLTTMNDTDIALKFEAAIHIQPNNSFNYMYPAE